MGAIKMKKLTAIVLSAAMLMTSIPSSAFAREDVFPAQEEMLPDDQSGEIIPEAPASSQEALSPSDSDSIEDSSSDDSRPEPENIPEDVWQEPQASVPGNTPEPDENADDVIFVDGTGSEDPFGGEEAGEFAEELLIEDSDADVPRPPLTSRRRVTTATCFYGVCCCLQRFWVLPEVRYIAKNGTGNK